MPLSDERLAEIRKRVELRLDTARDRFELLDTYDELRAEVERLRVKVAAVEASITDQDQHANIALRVASGSYEWKLQGRRLALREIRAALASGDEVRDA